MFGPNIRIAPVIGSEHQIGLEWSMRPIFLWLQILGIPSNLLQPASYRYTVLSFGITMMFWVTSSHIQFAIDYIDYEMNIDLNDLPCKISYNELRIRSLDHLQGHCITIVICLSFFVAGHLQWESLWKNACEIERVMKLNEAFARSLRKIVYLAATLLALEATSIIIQYFSSALVFCNQPIDSYQVSLIWKTGIWISQLYPVTAIIFFMILARMTSMMLENLIEELLVNDVSQKVILLWKVIEWKQQYRLINDYIYKINRFYGVILLSFLFTHLVYFITHIFFLIMDHLASRNSNDQYMSVFQLLRTVTYLFLLTSVSHRIKQKVLECGRLLRKLKFTDNTAQCQASFFIIDINLCTPKITGMGAFEIGPSILPSFMGVTLTYLIILFKLEVDG